MGKYLSTSIKISQSIQAGLRPDAKRPIKFAAYYPPIKQNFLMKLPPLNVTADQTENWIEGNDMCQNFQDLEITYKSLSM